jgi:CHRD domain
MIQGAAVICYTITAKDITLPATAAQIHVGATGINGNVVVPLKAPDATGVASGCVNSTRSLVAAILVNPSGYYANIHTMSQASPRPGARGGESSPGLSEAHPRSHLMLASNARAGRRPDPRLALPSRTKGRASLRGDALT